LSETVSRAYDVQFRAVNSAIITWNQVSEFSVQTRRNSFQVVLVQGLVGSESRSYLVFNYGRCDSVPPISIRFIDGFNSANSQSFNGNIFNSNVNVPGRFIFLVDSSAQSQTKQLLPQLDVK
jgi:hypothetical protein